MSAVKTVNIVGSGLAGLSAAISLAKGGVRCNLISVQPSERAQSVLAEGGINAALNTMGEGDSVDKHFEDTVKGGCYLSSERSVKELTKNAPSILDELVRLGVPFNSENGKLILRSFGGQKKKRTAFAKSSTGKMIMTALIDEARKFENSGHITRFSNHELFGIEIEDKTLKSITVRDIFTNEVLSFSGNTILCTGGLNGFFEGATTGTTQNTGNAAAICFGAGVEFANLEFIQYHPTTVSIGSKRMLISEAARGEGGRLFVKRKGEPWYFMEEKYSELGNLMPRDVISREMALLEKSAECEVQVFLDLTEINRSVWNGKLSDLRSEIIDYLSVDPMEKPIPVEPGIHFFMGGIRVNSRHETNIKGLFAAGEAACKYHGANRLGGNSMLGAVFGGKVAAAFAMQSAGEVSIQKCADSINAECSAAKKEKLRDLLLSGLGIIRNEESMQAAYDGISDMYNSVGDGEIDRLRALLGIAMIKSAIARKESRGAHFRTDYPDLNDEYKAQTCVLFDGIQICLRFAGDEEE